MISLEPDATQQTRALLTELSSPHSAPRLEAEAPPLPGGPNSSAHEDLIDALSELVVLRGGSVLVLPAERMPTHTGLAATYRY